MRITDLDTPSVIIDLDVMERNIDRMHAHLREHGINIRPHIKNHKIPAIAHLQMRKGASGITCQKLGEAEVMVNAGITDVLIAYNIVGDLKLERLSRLARQAKISVIADSEYIVNGLAKMATTTGVKLDVFVEYDIAAQRSGARTVEQAVGLARLIERTPGLAYKGLLSFRGYSPDPAYVRRTGDQYERVVTALKRDGIETSVISSGGTVEAWTAWPDICPWGVTECRPGLYTFYDRVKVAAGVATLEDCALKIVTTVVSRPTETMAVFDAGEKTLTEARYRFGGGEGCGLLVEYPNAIVTGLFEEHGIVDTSGCASQPRVGERVTIIPNYSSLVIDLADEVYGVRDELVETVWPVAARGKVK